MVFSSGFALCAAITSATALQIPLMSSGNQAPLGHPHGTKPLVNSTELQDLISGDRLMARAKKMYEIAKLGEEEYNHPTRVIGSAGTFAHVICCTLMLMKSQATSERCLTSMKLSFNLATTTQSPIKPSQLCPAMSLSRVLSLAMSCRSLPIPWA